MRVSSWGGEGGGATEKGKEEEGDMEAFW